MSAMGSMAGLAPAISHAAAGVPVSRKSDAGDAFFAVFAEFSIFL